MNEYYLTDEDIHGCEEESELIELRNKLNKASERIEQLEDTIKYILKIYEEKDVVYSFKYNSLIKETLEEMLNIDGDK